MTHHRYKSPTSGAEAVLTLLLGFLFLAFFFLVAMTLYAGIAWLCWSLAVWGGFIVAPPTLFGCFAAGAILAVLRSLTTK